MRDDAESPSNDNTEAIEVEAEAQVQVMEAQEEQDAAEVRDWYSPERAAKKERIRIAFVTGKASLAHLSRSEGLPYSTLSRWSVEEQWGEKKAEIALKTDEGLVENLTDFIAKERAAQVKRAISRAGKLRSLVDKAAENAERSEEGLKPSDVQALSTAEERADNIVRRNLGMDQQSGGGNSLSVNILAQSINLS